MPQQGNLNWVELSRVEAQKTNEAEGKQSISAAELSLGIKVQNSLE